MSMTESELKEIIRRAIAEHDKETETVRKAIPEPQEAHSDHILNCPSCFKDFVGKLDKTSEVACANCGLELGTREFAKKLDDCPHCHGKNTKEIFK